MTVDQINPNFYDDSPIDTNDKEKIKRLQKLFGIAVQYPLIRPLLPILLNLPLDKIYKTLWEYNNKRADKELYGGVI